MSLFLCAVFSCASARAGSDENILQEPKFFSMLQDIPLMPGLEEVEGGTVSFDKPEGRIIESVALMHNVTAEQVHYFYQVTLPQFGWGEISKNKFFRQSEFLEIILQENEGARLVKIMIKPAL